MDAHEKKGTLCDEWSLMFKVGEFNCDGVQLLPRMRPRPATVLSFGEKRCDFIIHIIISSNLIIIFIYFYYYYFIIIISYHFLLFIINNKLFEIYY